MSGARALTVFVCGPLTEALNGQELDEELRGLLELIHETLERGRMTVLSAHRDERWGEDEPSPEVIAERDLEWMQACDATVMVLATPSRPIWRTDGTFVELGWATALGKPVVVIGDLGAYRSALVRGLPSVSSGIRILPSQDVCAHPEVLLPILGQAVSAPCITSVAGRPEVVSGPAVEPFPTGLPA